MAAKKQTKTYLVTNPEDPSKVVYVNSTRNPLFASVGIFSSGEWFASLTTQADPIKAAKAAKSTNKYIARSILGELEEVEHQPNINYAEWKELV